MSVAQFDFRELAEKYKLSKQEGVDFWFHKQSQQWILTHDACEKIAVIENIHIAKEGVKPLNSSDTLVRFLITMVKVNKEGQVERQITSVGEADKSNCTSKYLGCMAEKRGIDRCVLKLINAYEWGVASETEADDFTDGKKVEDGNG